MGPLSKQKWPTWTLHGLNLGLKCRTVIQQLQHLRELSKTPGNALGFFSFRGEGCYVYVLFFLSRSYFHCFVWQTAEEWQNLRSDCREWHMAKERHRNRTQADVATTMASTHGHLTYRHYYYCYMRGVKALSCFHVTQLNVLHEYSLVQTLEAEEGKTGSLGVYVGPILRRSKNGLCCQLWGIKPCCESKVWSVFFFFFIKPRSQINAPVDSTIYHLQSLE